MAEFLDEERVLVGLGIIAVASLFYGFFVASSALVGVSVAVSLAMVYLAWRFVRAHERLADASERLADRPEE